MILNTLFKNLKHVVNNSVIKFTSIAKSYETIDTIKSANEYIDAINQLDTFNSYSEYEYEIIATVMSMYNDDEIQEFAAHPSTIPQQFRDTILNKTRESIISNYEEGNYYYRSLNGLPKDESQFIILTDEMKTRSNIIIEDDSVVYIHNLSTVDLYKLEESGILTELKNNYPSYKYLNHLGSNKIAIEVSRPASNFSILYINKSDDISATFYDSFIRIYNQCREYFMTVIYNREYSATYNLYDNFIGLCIMIMTIQRIVSMTFKNGIEREFFDWEFIQNIYKVYNIPFITTLPIDYHITILKNLNNLLRYKSTDKVLLDVCSLLGYKHLDIYRYYMVRQQKMDSNEQPIFVYKTAETLTGNGSKINFTISKKFKEINSVTIDGTETTDYEYNAQTNILTFKNNLIPENDSVIVITPEKELDYENTFDIYFQSVNIQNKNIIAAMQDLTNKYEYSIITENDPYWWEDENTDNMKYGIITDDNGTKFESGYNYIRTKYMGLNFMYNMTNTMFELTYAYNVAISNKSSISDIYIEFPKIYQGISFPLFDSIIFILALACKLNGFEGNVLKRPSTISHIYSVMDDDDNIFTPVDKEKIYSFNFNSDDIVTIKTIINKNKKILNTKNSPNASDYLISFFNNLNVTNDNTIDDIYLKIKEFNSFIVAQMRNSTTIKEYKIYKKIYQISMLSDIQPNIYKYKILIPSNLSDFERNDNHTEIEDTEQLEDFDESCYLFTLNKTSCEPSLYIDDEEITDIHLSYDNDKWYVYIPTSLIDIDTNLYAVTTYLEYLHQVQPVLYNAVNNTSQENISTMIEHVSAQIEHVLSSLEYSFFINGTNNPILTAIKSLLNFFKSYTTDLTMMNIYYLFNSKYENLIKIIDTLQTIDKESEVSDSINYLYSDTLSYHTLVKDAEYSIFRDSCKIIRNIE